MDIPIHIKDGQTKIVTFTGKGVRYTVILYKNYILIYIKNIIEL